MEMWEAALLALAVGSITTGSVVWLSQHPEAGTFLMPWHCPALYGYCFVYGVIAAGLTMASPYLPLLNAVKIGGVAIDNVWVNAILIGLLVRVIIGRPLAISINGKSFNIGALGSRVDKVFLRKIRLNVLFSQRRHVQGRMDTMTKKTLTETQRLIRRCVRDALPFEEETALMGDLKNIADANPADYPQDEKIEDSLCVFLNVVGRKNFNQAIGQKKP